MIHQKHLTALIREFKRTIPAEIKDYCRKQYLKDELDWLQAEAGRIKTLLALIETESTSENDLTWFRELVVDWKLKPIKKKRELVEFQLETLCWPQDLRRNDRYVGENEIQQARETDIMSLHLVENPIACGNSRHKVRCLFHDDKNPSMVIYPGDRGAYCFSCSTSSNAIDVVMKILGFGFVDAVRYILKVT